MAATGAVFLHLIAVRMQQGRVSGVAFSAFVKRKKNDYTVQPRQWQW